MVRRYMPTYRRSKKLGAVNTKSLEAGRQGDNEGGGKKDKIAPSQWKEENSSRCHSASLARTVSERLRNESVWLMKEVGRATQVININIGVWKFRNIFILVCIGLTERFQFPPGGEAA